MTLIFLTEIFGRPRRTSCAQRALSRSLEKALLGLIDDRRN